MHLPIEMVGKSAVIVQAAEICATHVADLELLVTRRPTCIGECLQFTFPLPLQLLGLSQFEVLGDCEIHTARGREYLDLLEAS